MRTWRVGTVSMGAALVLLGVLLLLSRVFAFDIYTIMLSWWPAILIVLGIEIIVFLFITGKEKAVVKYDIFSIIFIGFIGTVGIAFALVSSLGIVDEVKDQFTRQEETRDLPMLLEQLPTSVTRVVIEADRTPLVIEETTSREYSIFGTYRTQFSKNDTQILKMTEEYVTTHQKGETLYVTLKRLPERNNWNYSYSTMAVTMLVPSNVNVEVRKSQEVVLRPRTINADFLIEQVSDVIVHLPVAASDVLLQAINVHQLNGSDLEWDVTPMEDTSDEWGPKNAQIQLGEGTNKITILNSHSVSFYN
ncbi:MAG: LiaI-LiaF-like domain-containing protein [Anaerobacillus sp.]|uniref:LiaI-LiaF-like domain-containing protein n=1 Tax=Anaerobacillus sp. TaxID=1872506 RepID=UPI00391C6B83